MTQNDLTEPLQFAIEITRAAGVITREGFALAQQRALDVTFKARFDPLTEYDQRSEAYLTQALRARFPEHAIIGEEGANERAGARCVWHLDPIDGTTNFSHGHPWYCVSTGLTIDGIPAVGVVYDPVNERLFAAATGLGATLNGVPIRVSETSTLEGSLLTTGFPYDRTPTRDNNLAHFLDFIQVSQDVRRPGAAALDFCVVAAGWLDGYWQPQLKSYDIVAGIVIVREAGGVVTDFSGGDAMLDTLEVVASNGRVHAAMLDVLRVTSTPHLQP
jgi:myo-inositol-1(or 4)-monophosphatase